MATYQPFTEGDSSIQAQPEQTVQSQPAAMQVVVQSPMPSTAPDDSVLYWLACIFCNCCGLTLMALTLHCVAQGLYESGQSNWSAARGVWSKARSLRTAGCICSAITIVLFIIIRIVAAVFIMDSINTVDGDN
eukprot:UN02521